MTIPKSYYIYILLTILAIAAGGYWYNSNSRLTGDQKALEVMQSWNHLLMDLDRATSGYSAPVSARMFAYTTLAAYEASLPGNPGYRSLGHEWGGYEQLPWKNEVRHFLPAASLNTAYAAMTRKFFPGASVELQKRINTLEKYYTEKMEGLSDETSMAFSRNYGRRTAEIIWRWSMTDSVGFGGPTYCTDCTFKPQNCTGCWLPDDEKNNPAVLPWWGKVRPFVVPVNSIQAQPPLPYDEAPGSPLFGEAMEVFTSSQPLTSESHLISQFWSDDITGLTVTPTGRWISIITQAAEKSKCSAAETLEMYLRIALALHDSYVVCWDLKYKYRIERPQSYITRVIQPDWQSYAPSAAYPGYPAAHALVAAAAAEILTQALGESFSFTDRTYEGREELAGMPRSYHSFREMSQEIAVSRILLGVHFRMDCEEGLRLGREIGQQVGALQLAD